jgi:hypothetical protein
MKIILSRKGFDSSNGGQPSPIMPDGTLLSLPIPNNDDHDNTYSSITWNGMTYHDIIRSLKPNSHIKYDSYCHLDPDLRKEIRDRECGWQPAFGQMSSSLTLLRHQNVSVGDLFLFFGWFKATVIINGRLVYKKHAPDLHVIYGYLQVGKIIEKKCDIPDWLKTHPHASYNDSWQKEINAIYLPYDHLSFLDNMNGSGVLDYRPDRVLTKSGYSRGRWNLPSFFKDVKITCNPNPWKEGYFQSARIGQEFVMDATTEIQKWAKQIII